METTYAYLRVSLELKERALAKTEPFNSQSASMPLELS